MNKGSAYLRNFGSKGKIQGTECCDTLTASMGAGGGNVPIIMKKENMNNLRIRKLTPRECFRLMGVKDEDYDKVCKNQSDSSLYHLAGDSICTTVLMAIFKELI